MISRYEHAKCPAKVGVKGFSYSQRVSPGVLGLVRAAAQAGGVDTGHLCLCRASLDRGRVTRVGRGPRGPGGPRQCPGEARGEGGPAGKREVSGGATAPSHGSRARSQPEAGGIAIVFGEHINPRADPRAPRFPPEGHSVSSEALYRGPGPGLRRGARPGGQAGARSASRPQVSATGGVREVSGDRRAAPNARTREQEEDPLLRGFPDASSSSGARPAPVRGSGEKGEGSGSSAAASQAAAGIGAGAGLVGVEGVRVRAARVRVRGGARPGPPPPTPAVSAPLALVCGVGVGVGGGWRRLEPGDRPTAPPLGPECTDPPLCSPPSPPPCRREAPLSLPSSERGRAGRAGPGWSCGGGRRSRACSEGPTEARGRERGDGSAALPPPPLAIKRWRRSGEPGDSSAPPPSGSAACCCSGAGSRAPRPPGAASRRSPQVRGGRGSRARQARVGAGAPHRHPLRLRCFCLGSRRKRAGTLPGLGLRKRKGVALGGEWSGRAGAPPGEGRPRGRVGGSPV